MSALCILRICAIGSLTMWKASAIRAKECTIEPTINSIRKNATSIPSIMLIRVDLDHAIVMRDLREHWRRSIPRDK